MIRCVLGWVLCVLVCLEVRKIVDLLGGIVELGLLWLVQGGLLGRWVSETSLECGRGLGDVSVLGLVLALFAGLRYFEVDAVAAFGRL